MLVGATAIHSAVIRSEVLYGLNTLPDSVLWTGIRVGRRAQTHALQPTRIENHNMSQTDDKQN